MLLIATVEKIEKELLHRIPYPWYSDKVTKLIVAVIAPGVKLVTMISNLLPIEGYGENSTLGWFRLSPSTTLSPISTDPFTNSHLREDSGTVQVQTVFLERQNAPHSRST